MMLSGWRNVTPAEPLFAASVIILLALELGRLSSKISGSPACLRNWAKLSFVWAALRCVATLPPSSAPGTQFKPKRASLGGLGIQEPRNCWGQCHAATLQTNWVRPGSAVDKSVAEPVPRPPKSSKPSSCHCRRRLHSVRLPLLGRNIVPNKGLHAHTLLQQRIFKLPFTRLSAQYNVILSSYLSFLRPQ